jgi:D-amino-acid oxidase
MNSVLVLGAGVAGLSCALRLQRAGHAVTIWAHGTTPHTTSDVAGAIWLTYEARPPERVQPWATATLREFMELASAHCGVTMRAGFEFVRGRPELPWWSGVVPAFRAARADELPPGCEAGWAFTSAVIEMPVYLRWLMARFEAQGGVVRARAVRDLSEALTVCPAVVNCTGLGARDLVHDEAVEPIRGQVVRVEQPGIERFLLAESGPDDIRYVIPRSRDCVLGGTAEPGRESLEPDPGTAARIIDRCAALEPRLRNARVLGHGVGLRPGRPEVRLDTELHPGGVVVHNYGHGGAGVTLSWGCADEVAERIAAALGARPA